ncbi:hypothetical protein pb186bvf_003989 [Paramecium bursaria]
MQTDIQYSIICSFFSNQFQIKRKYMNILTLHFYFRLYSLTSQIIIIRILSNMTQRDEHEEFQQQTIKDDKATLKLAYQIVQQTNPVNIVSKMTYAFLKTISKSIKQKSLKGSIQYFRDQTQEYDNEMTPDYFKKGNQKTYK